MMQTNYIYIKNLEKKINIGFFTSKGGVSKGNFHSLNCNRNSNDKKNNVKNNIKIALKKLCLEKKKLKLISQIHSNKVYLINNKNYKDVHNGDGLITTVKDIALGILTADCAPIFIFDKNKKVICCLHSGWKGTLSNIVKESIIKLKKRGIKTCELIAIVGPCLGIKNFEVHKDFKKKFIKKNHYYSTFFKFKNKNKDLFDLRAIINHQLKIEGIDKVYNIKKDTYKNSHIFFSHRRSTHKNNVDGGRMINIISFRD